MNKFCHIPCGLLRGSQIFTSEPEYIKVSSEPWLDSIHIKRTVAQRILATDFEHFEKGSAFRGYMRSLLGTGVFNADGETDSWTKSQHRPTYIPPGELWKCAHSPLCSGSPFALNLP